MVYIATFYSHFGAVRFKRGAAVTAPRLMPVPRSLSSSCGTCVRFEAADDYRFTEDPHEEVEQIVRETERGYEVVYVAGEG